MELESDGSRDQYVVRDGLDGVILRTLLLMTLDWNS